MEQILSWVKSGLLFGIISSMILLLSPNKSYEKHMSLVVGLLFLLVMIHPIMTFFGIDGQTYISYIQNYIGASENGGELSDQEINLYKDTIKLQLEKVLEQAGYRFRYVDLCIDEKGNVYRIAVSFEDKVDSIESFENYIKNVFGKEVEIIYE